jgi:uroporphyrinogen decarboxylase
MKLQNDLFLRAARGEEVERPPVWLMRQAGRILPQYRAVRERLSGFKELAETPALAAEVTVQPVDELKVDAAIIFSDILVIPEAMGLPYEMAEQRGPWFPRTISSAADVEALLSGPAAAERLAYVYEALEITRRELAGRVPLIGFSGAPWTLLAYMVEGRGSKTFSKAKAFLYNEPRLAHRLLEKITATVIAYLQEKIRHGADLVQLFDSWAGILGPEQYREFSLPYLRAICTAIEAAPVTVFAKGAWFALEEIGQLDCQVVGLDWTVSPQEGRRRVGPRPVLQGNLDPCALYAAPEAVAAAAQRMLDAFGRRHIANLGHGVYPDTPLENVRTYIQAVQAYRYKN